LSASRPEKRGRVRAELQEAPVEGPLGTHFVVRTCNDRLAGDGTHTVASEMAEARVRGLHRVELRDAEGEVIRAVLEIRARRVHLLPPVGKQRRYPPRSTSRCCT